MNPNVRKVGRITVAVGLVALGLGLLADNLFAAGPVYTSAILRFWPVLLIGFGVEYLVFGALDRAGGGEPGRLRFDVGGAILLLVVLGLTAGFSNVSRWISLDPRDYVGGPASARTETASVPAGGARAVEVDIDMGRVELYTQRLSEVRVEATYTMGGFLRLREQDGVIDDFKLDLVGGETIRLTGRAPSQQINLRSIGATYRVYVPENVAVRVSTNAGSIQVHDFRGDLTLSAKLGSVVVEAGTGSLTADTISGLIRVADVTGPVTARTSAGAIHLDRVAGAMQLESGTGAIAVTDSSGERLSAETNTGAISVRSRLAPEGDVTLRTSTGSISLTLPESSSVRMSARTKTGSIAAPSWVQVSSDGPARSAQGSLGDGKHLVTLEANLGSIRLGVE